MRFTVRLPNEKTLAAVMSVISASKIKPVTRGHHEPTRMGVGWKIKGKPYARTGFVEPSKRAVAGFYNLASQIVNMISSRHALFHELPRLPEGFRYKEEFLPPA